MTKFSDRYLPLVIISFVLAIFAFLPSASEARSKSVPQSREVIRQSFAPIVKKAAPAVVNVYVRQKRQKRRRGRLGSMFSDPFFDRFFGEDRERRQNSLGSGVIVSRNGLVVTNYHVIAEGQGGNIKIAFADKREYAAKLVLKDEKTDLAVLKIEAGREKFPYLNLGNSDHIEVGDLVLAIGNPFGVGQTVTSGIISAVSRAQKGVSSYQPFIQTDAAINPGNSGGALIDIDGQLIGINTAIFSKSGGSLGIGFAVPSNIVSLVIQSAKSGYRSVRRPWLGAHLQAVNSEIANSIGFKKPTGVILSNISKRSPAGDAGLRSGDIVLEVDGHEVVNAQAFIYRFTARGVGGNARIKVWRDGRIRRFSVNREPAPEIPARARLSMRGNHPFDGATIVNLSPAVAEEYGVAKSRGVLVESVSPRSAAHSIGLKKSDIVLRIGRKDITSTRQLNQVMRQPRRFYRISILRGREVLNFVLGG